MRRIPFDEVDPTDSLEYVVDGQPYTGEVIETGPDGEMRELITVVDGLPQGPSRSWYADGTLKSEEMAFRGRPVGTAREWHPNGALASESRFDSNGMRLDMRVWDGDGELMRSEQYASSTTTDEVGGRGEAP